MDRQITDLSARYRALPPGDPDRCALAYELGKLLMVRFVERGGLPADRDRAIELFEEAIAAGSLSSDDDFLAHGGAGSLLTLRAIPAPLASDPTGANMFAWAAAMTNGPGLFAADTQEDVNRAVRHLRHVVEHAPTDSPVRAQVQGALAFLQAFQVAPHLGLEGAAADPAASTEAARQLDDAVQTMPPSPERDLLGGLWAVLLNEASQATGGIDPTRAEEIIAALQKAIDALPGGHALRPSLLAEQATLLGTVGQATGSAAALAGAPALVEQALTGMDSGDPRRGDLVRKLSGLLVAAVAYQPGDADVDRIVRLAEELLAGDASADPAARGKDHYLRAMALTLRGRRDGSAADLRSAVDDLRRALELVPAKDPIAAAIAATLGALLHDRTFAAGVLEDAEAARFHLDQARAVLQAHSMAGVGSGLEGYTVGALLALHSAAAAIQRRDPALLDAAIVDLRAAVGAFPPGYPWRSRFDGVLGLALLARGAANGQLDDLRAGLALMEDAAATMAVEASGRPALTALGGAALLLRGLLNNDDAAITAGADRLADATAAGGVSHPERVAILAASANAHLIRYERAGDRAELDAAVERLQAARDQLADGAANPQASYLLRQLAGAYWQRADTLAGPARDAERERAVRTGLDGLRAHVGNALLQSSPAHGLTAVQGATADAQRVATWCLDAGLHELAVEAVELGRGLVLHAAASSAQVTAMLHDAGQAELAAEWQASDAGQSTAWSTAADPDVAAFVELTDGFLHGGAPTDLRRRVLEALRGTPAAQRLLAAPGPVEISRALRTLDIDALVYLLPGDGDRRGRLLLVDSDGWVADVAAPELTVAADGPVTAFLAAHERRRGRVRSGRTHRDLEPDDPDGAATGWPQALARVCDWAWPAAIQPLVEHGARPGGDRPPRLALVPGGMLGCVPWQAARRPTAGGYRYACAELVLSYTASARQLLDVAARTAGPPAGAPVLVADPTASLPGATIEIDALNDRIYPDATVLGRAAARVGEGTPAEVLAHLPGATEPRTGLIHLACHANAGRSPDRSYLTLAAGAATGSPTTGSSTGNPTGGPATAARLPVAAILRRAHRRPTGGALVVVLSACTTDVTADAYDEALTLATAFLAAGATTVVGSLWAVPDATTPHLMYLFHHYLTEQKMPAADALRAAQLWMLDPDRTPPPGMPATLAATSRSVGLAAIDAWAAFTHHGR